MAEIISTGSVISEVLAQREGAILEEWLNNIHSARNSRASISEGELRQQCSRFLRSFRNGFEGSGSLKLSDSHWNELRDLLTEICTSRALQGFASTEVAGFIFCFKEPLFQRLREVAQEPETLATQIWDATELLDAFGL